jgi:hypothetical protein
VKQWDELSPGDYYSGSLKVRVIEINGQVPEMDGNGEIPVLVIRDEGEFWSTVSPEFLNDEPQESNRDPRAPFPPGQDRTR